MSTHTARTRCGAAKARSIARDVALGLALAVAPSLGLLSAAPVSLARASAPAARVSSQHSCAPSGSHVLAHDSEASVYTPAQRSSTPPAAREIDACASGHKGHMTLLAVNTTAGAHRSLNEFELSGHVVGYVETQFGVDSGSSKLVIADVSARRTLRSVVAGAYVDAGLISSEHLTQFVLTPHGSVAWIVERSEHRQLVSLTLRAAPRSGSAVVLDSGLDIAPRSLRLAAGTLRWQRGGADRFAHMP